MDIKTEAINKALRLLDAAKTKYKVITEDGQEFGELEVAKKPKYKLRRNVFVKTGYMEKIKTMDVGDVVVLTPPEGSTCEQMRSAVCGTLNRVYGAGACMTTINKQKDQIEILRLS